jgi:cytochrome c553
MKTFAKPSVVFAGLLFVAQWAAWPTISVAQEVTFDSPAAATADSDFEVQGEYVNDKLGLQVIALGKGDFDLLLYQGGLPGDGWDGTAPQKFDGESSVVRQLAQSRGLKKIERQSPTLGAQPPIGAVVLFDGTQKSLDDHWNPGAKRTADGLLIQGAMTKEKFRDYTLHIEFRTPFQPSARGQGRGNSGVYHQGRYETQVLDSFGLTGKNNETGGIYEVRDPDLNMCFPPLIWQTYDVDFTAARFDDSGRKTDDAILTVRLNGVLVQNTVKVPAPTRAAPLAESPEPGPIYLQDHGNPVRYRNVWLVPRDADKDARRPRVPGFERFFANHTNAPESAALGGRLLLSQLGCTACHASESPDIVSRSAPDLARVGTRVRRDHLLEFITSPHAVKSGTPMPDLLHGMADKERQHVAQALASYLATTGQIIDRSGDSAAARRGEQSFHSLGCAMCHAPRRGENNLEGTSVPLGNLTAKYTLDSLSKFLMDPHAVRASGLMPKLTTDMSEARDIACYLLGESIIVPGAEQFQATVYFGSWDNLPKFEDLTAEKAITTSGLDISIAGRRDNFGIRFEAFLPINVAGRYRFHLGSDDGSRLMIDDREVVNADGVHPLSMRQGQVHLEPGVHRLRLDYFEKNGGEELVLEVEGPDFGRTPIAALVTADPKGNANQEILPSKFAPQEELVGLGKELFYNIGCAKCHAMQSEATVVTLPNAKPLSELTPERGCLAPQVAEGLPNYDLTDIQRSAIRAALFTIRTPVTTQQQLHLHLAGNNCYACHYRSGHGPEVTRDSLFLTRMQEMGNEGRVPPPLDGVGDKLKSDYLVRTIAEGTKVRPYMLTRMPAFGATHGTTLQKLFTQVDRPSASSSEQDQRSAPVRNESLAAAGRKLVGNDGLACIKCHTFGDKATPGIQAMDMKRMAERLNADWFHRYMLEPTRYRPGTRMPLSFPEGKSVLTSVFDGHADKQIDAMWFYLSQGDEAREPVGMDAESIVLSPTEKPIIYRNFIEGVSPRGIAVGYPAQCNLAWDAEKMALVLIWKNGFIDASKHWVGRGPGFQKPLGDFVTVFENSAPFAILSSADAAWPRDAARDQQMRFKGYRLDAAGQPTFRYAFAGVNVEDYPTPVFLQETAVGLTRELKIHISKPTPGLVFRGAAGKLTRVEGGFLLNDQIRISLTGVVAKLVEVEGQQELRATLPASGDVHIVETISW